MRKFNWSLTLIVILCFVFTFSIVAENPDKGFIYTLNEYEEMTGKEITEFNDSPMLQERVEEGELPEVDERLPENPAVIEPYEGIGEFGGTWHTANLGTGDGWSFWARHAGLETLVRYHPTKGLLEPEVRPNLAKDWEVSEDGKTFTFYLREGIKWSDGEPFDVDDIMFWYNGVLQNEELTSSVPGWLDAGNGEIPEVEKIDQYTVRFEFDETHGLFLRYLAEVDGQQILVPKHYAKQFHPEYTEEEELMEKVEEEGFEEWFQLYDHKVGDVQTGMITRTGEPTPTLRPYIQTLPYGETDHVKFERNPYYWKVDPAGNQLPYIDYQRSQIVEDSNVIAMMAVAGDIDMQHRNVPKDQISLFLKNEDRGKYTAEFKTDNFVHNVLAFSPNLAHEDSTKREIFNNKKFRIALSLAINREDMIETFFPGIPGIEPSQVAPPPDHIAHIESQAKQYVEYDPEEAKELLKEVGFQESDESDYMVGPDGEPLIIKNMVCQGEGIHAEIAEQVVEYWQDVGLDVRLDIVERSLFGNRSSANDFDIQTWYGLFTKTQPEGISFTMPTFSALHIPAATWYQTKGSEGEKPDGDIREAQKLYTKLTNIVDPIEQDEIFREIFKLHEENFWRIGLFTDPGYLMITKNNMHNIPEEYNVGWMNVQPSTLGLEQIWKSEE